eukprot:6455909-Amphidinium_carterae.1
MVAEERRSVRAYAAICCTYACGKVTPQQRPEPCWEWWKWRSGMSFLTQMRANTLASRSIKAMGR